MHLEPVPFHAEAMLAGDFVEDLADRLVVEFDQASALLADEMIVLRVAVIVLPDFAVILAGDLAEQPASSSKASPIGKSSSD